MAEKAREGLVHVCLDREPGNPGYIVCNEQVDPFNPESPYTGSECAAVGLAPVCRIDFIPQARVPGRLALFGDELPLDGDGNSNGIAQSGLTIELIFELQRTTFVELFETTKIGNWNPFFESGLASGDVFEFTLGPSIFQFSNGNLTELGLAIRDRAQEFYTNLDLSDAVPVLIDVISDWNKVPVDGSLTGLGSASYFRVQIRFARVRP